jgi:excisionase family DNA binding protein
VLQETTRLKPRKPNPYAKFENHREWADARGRRDDIIAVTVKFAAEVLNVTTTTIDRMVTEGRLKTIKIGRKLLIQEASLMVERKEYKRRRDEIEGILIEAAYDRETIFSGGVMKEVALDHTLFKDQGHFARILDEISEETHDVHGFMLSAIVHRSGPGITMPGPSFWRLATRLYGPIPDKAAFIVEQTARIHSFYTAKSKKAA